MMRMHRVKHHTHDVHAACQHYKSTYLDTARMIVEQQQDDEVVVIVAIACTDTTITIGVTTDTIIITALTIATSIIIGVTIATTPAACLRVLPSGFSGQ